MCAGWRKELGGGRERIVERVYRVRGRRKGCLVRWEGEGGKGRGKGGALRDLSDR